MFLTGSIAAIPCRFEMVEKVAHHCFKIIGRETGLLLLQSENGSIQLLWNDWEFYEMLKKWRKLVLWLVVIPSAIMLLYVFSMGPVFFIIVRYDLDQNSPKLAAALEVCYGPVIWSVEGFDFNGGLR